MKGKLILVDETNQVMGYADKLPTHKMGILHRAFSLFIYSKEEKKFLLQRRSEQKYHSGGKWSNACCSHPYKDESWYISLKRGVFDELNICLDINHNITCDIDNSAQFIDENLFFCGAFIYFSDCNNGLCEYEFDYVFVYTVDSVTLDIAFNTSEVSEIKWLTKEELENSYQESPDTFSPWFYKAFSLVDSNYLNNQITE